VCGGHRVILGLLMIRRRDVMAEATVPSLEWLRKRLEETDPDLRRAMVEGVVATLTRSDPRHRDNRQESGRTINVSMTVVTRDADSFRRSQGQITAELAQLLRRAERNL
jgi:hypothetical protein